ncbi:MULTISPECIES: hypothetical protein [unclassified Streptomyces]|uniref:hypothetical protein n=1 Tax=unclassified Streptomyces TaxID=2593676 RepID=UPI0038080BD0
MTLLVLGVAVAPGAAYAVDGDDHVARMRLRVVNAINEDTRLEIERVRACTGGASSGEVARLEHKLQEGCRLAAELRAVRPVKAQGVRAERAGFTTASASGGGPVPGDDAFRAARRAIPHTPVGVLSVVGGAALVLVGGGAAAAVVRQRPRAKG